jgi:hypothetical protein
MHTIVGVTTYNPVVTMRFDLLEITIKSIEKAFPTAVLCLLSNGSADGSEEAIRELCGEQWRLRFKQPSDSWDCYGSRESPWSPGAGRVRLFNMMDANSLPPVLYVWSDDDMRWREGAQETLARFWSLPAGWQHRRVHPTKVTVLSGLLEPEWHWNTPRETIQSNGVRVLARDSAPGAAFSFLSPFFVCPRNKDFPGDYDEQTFGYDHKICKRLIKGGRKVAQIDLAEHVGWRRSTHGNEAIDHVGTRPLDRERWKV